MNNRILDTGGNRFTRTRTTVDTPRSRRSTGSHLYHVVEHNDSTSTDCYSEQKVDSDVELAHEIPFSNVTRDPRIWEFIVLILCEKRFDRLMSYRYYRLRLTNQDCTHGETFRLHKKLQKLERTFKDCKFSGEEQILTFDFFTMLVEEADTLDIS